MPSIRSKSFTLDNFNQDDTMNLYSRKALCVAKVEE